MENETLKPEGKELTPKGAELAVLIDKRGELMSQIYHKSKELNENEKKICNLQLEI